MRFEVLGQRTVGHRVGEETGVLLPGHEEGVVVGGLSRDEVAHVVLEPLLAVPFDEHALRIPGLALRVGGAAVVEDAAVGGPGEGPAGEETETGRVFLRAVCHRLLHRVELLGLVVVVAREDPHAASGRAVSLKLAVALEELAVADRVAVEGPAEGAQIGLAVDRVVEVRLQDLIRAGAAFLLVELDDVLPEKHHHLEVGTAFSRRLDGLFTPLDPPTGVVDGADFFIDERGGKEVDLGLDVLGLHVRSFPEGRGLRLEPVSDDEPVEVGHRVAGVLAVRGGMHRIHAPAEVALDLVVAHVVERHDRGVVAVVELRADLRQQVVAVVVLDRGVGAEPFAKLGDPELRLVGIVARGDVGRTLNVRFAAKGVDAAARYADVAEQKLDDAHGAAVLGAVGVLRLTEGVEDGARLVGTAGGGEDLPDLLHDVGIHASDARDELGRVAGIVTLHDVEDAVRILKGHVALEDLEVRRLELRRARTVDPGEGGAFGSVPDGLVFDVVAPGFIVVALRFRIPAGKEAVIDVELEVGTQQAGGVRVVQDVFLLEKVVLQDVVDQAAVEGKVGARTDAGVDVGAGGRTGVARIDHDPRGALVLGALDPAGGERMVFDVVRTDRHDDVGVGEVAPVARHGAAAERRRKTGNGRRVTDAGLVVDGEDAEAARELLHEPAFLVVKLGGA